MAAATQASHYPVLRLKLATSALLRLTALGARRTVPERGDLVLLWLLALGVGAAHVAPGDGRALDRWAAQAVAFLLVLPAAAPNTSPLDALRVRLLPVSARALVAARLLAGAPLRLALVPPGLAAVTLALARVAAPGASRLAAAAAFAGWACAAVAAGAPLDLVWARPGWRAHAARGAAYALLAWAACAALPAPARPSWVPDLPPFLTPALDVPAHAAAGWLVAAACAAAALGLADALLAPPARARRGAPGAASAARRAPPRVPTRSATAAREAALLARHGFTRGALAATGLVAFVATYGRVPGIAAGVLLVWLVPLGNALGPDVPMGGRMRHHVTPLGARVVRDRRCAAWGVAAAAAALTGAAFALLLPADAARPAGGALAAPALALYAASVLPHAGRASWWFAARYPQRARATRAGATHLGVRADDASVSPPFWAVPGAVATWAAVAVAAVVLFAAASAAAAALYPADAGAAWDAGVGLASAAAVALFALTRARA